MSLKEILAPLILLILISLAMTEGCDDRSAEVAREAADRQAAQNETMARLQGEVAAGTRRLVEEESKTRQKTFHLQRDLQAERSQLGQSWDHLETQRQAVARQRRTESFLTALVTGGGGALACLLALAFAVLTLFGLSRRDDSAQIASELLIEELVADRPRFIPLSPPPDNAGRLSAPPAEDGPVSPPALPPPTGRHQPHPGEIV